MELGAARREARGGTGERESAEGRVLRREGKERRGRKGRGDGEADIHAVVMLTLSLSEDSLRRGAQPCVR